MDVGIVVDFYDVVKLDFYCCNCEEVSKIFFMVYVFFIIEDNDIFVCEGF